MAGLTCLQTSPKGSCTSPRHTTRHSCRRSTPIGRPSGSPLDCDTASQKLCPETWLSVVFQVFIRNMCDPLLHILYLPCFRTMKARIVVSRERCAAATAQALP